jgi:hypothetical protein
LSIERLQVFFEFEVDPSFSLQDFLHSCGFGPRCISFLLLDCCAPIGVANVGGLRLQLGLALLDELMPEDEAAKEESRHRKRRGAPPHQPGEGA